jgi:hypothetical protein
MKTLSEKLVLLTTTFALPSIIQQPSQAFQILVHNFPAESSGMTTRSNRCLDFEMALPIRELVVSIEKGRGRT